jgi:hypothetical protein
VARRTARNLAGACVVIRFSLPTRQAVNERYAELTSACYTGASRRAMPFWGCPSAIAADRDGLDIRLMSPADESRRTWPLAQSRTLKPRATSSAALFAIVATSDLVNNLCAELPDLHARTSDR